MEVWQGDLQLFAPVDCGFFQLFGKYVFLGCVPFFAQKNKYIKSYDMLDTVAH